MELSRPLSHNLLICIIFCASGFSALVYEVLWTKHLSLVFGTTMGAAGLVVATFLFGLALGGYWFGKRVDRSTNPLRLYALIELGIAASALLFPLALRLVELSYVFLARQFPEAPFITKSTQLLLCALLLLVPTICMGGTLPVICCYFRRNNLLQSVGRLYACNVFGAAAGAFVCGYFLIPYFGHFGAGLLAIALSLAIAIVSWLVGRGAVPLTAPTAVDETGGTVRVDKPGLVLVCTFLLGGGALAYQLLWTRILTLSLGNTTYAFAAVLSVYLLGIAGGGAAFARLCRSTRNLTVVFAFAPVIAGLYVLATAPFYDRIPDLVFIASRLAGESWVGYSSLTLLIIVLVLGVPTALSGIMFPAAIGLYAPERVGSGGKIGKVLFWNTLGAALGSLAGAFALLPLFGSLGGLKFVSMMSVMTGSFFAFMHWRQIGKESRKFLSLAIVSSAVLLLIPIGWDQLRMNSGMYYYADANKSWSEVDKYYDSQRLLAVYEGLDSTVTVRGSQVSGIKYFTVNGKVDGGSGVDMATQILLGQLPVLLHPSPKEILVIGLGTGITLKSASLVPARHIDCVEISAAVVKASHHFDDVSLDPLADARIELHINDARNFLLVNNKKYDVVISEPSNPWQTGNANLFTSEFFRLVSSRLNRGGIFCQWIPLYDLSLENIRILSKTFASEFPQCHLFLENDNLLLLGVMGEERMDYQQLRAKIAAYYANSPFTVVAGPAELLAKHYLFSTELIQQFSAGAQINTDLRPIIEYSARHNLASQKHKDSARKNIEALLAMTKTHKQKLPIVNLGFNAAEIALSLQEISEQFARAGKGNIASRDVF